MTVKQVPQTEATIFLQRNLSSLRGLRDISETGISGVTAWHCPHGLTGLRKENEIILVIADNKGVAIWYTDATPRSITVEYITNWCLSMNVRTLCMV